MDFSRLHEEYQHFFNILETPPPPRPSYDNVYFMAFDAEWYQSGERNVVLSYQIATVCRTAARNIIDFVPPGKRLSLAEIVHLGICSVTGGVIPDDHATAHNLVVLISHSTVAEWSVLADRDAPYITKQLTAIRKSPVTSINPIRITLGDYTCPCDVHLYDTRLIAPADFQSLKRLSTLLGSDDELKVNIGYHHIKHMDRLIRIDYPLYEKYALQDSEITLKLFFLLQSTLMDLAGYDKKLYRTLASGAVTGFFNRATNFSEYQSALKSAHFETFYNFIRSAYHGGRNEGYFVGRSDRVPGINDRLWVDIDFVGCYPTAMALCPTIDCGVDPVSDKKVRSKKPPPDPIPGIIKYLPLRHHLPPLSDEKLVEAGIKREYYNKAKSILDKITPDADPQQHMKIMSVFNKFLKGIKLKRVRDQLRDKAVVFDNSLIDSWYERWNSRIDNNEVDAERYIIPGFAKVRFAFNDATLYPCLPVSHPSYGLIYPLKGETFVTAPEIMLALDAGAEIKALVSIELPTVVDNANPVPRRLFFEHLANLTVKRMQQKRISKDGTKSADERQRAVVLERFIKEFVNSFYGKTAQAINYKKMYDPETGLMVALGPSPISEACTAALATGLPRSALSAMLLSVDRFNQDKTLKKRIIVASATTDGLLVGLPRPEGVTAASYYKVVVKELIEPVVAGKGGCVTETRCLEMKNEVPGVNEILELCGCGDLVRLFESYMPIRQMRNARKELTGGTDSTFLEIKHFADQVAGIKTRGQIGWVHFEGENIVTIQAKFGLKPPVTDIIAENMKQNSVKELDAEYDRITNAGGTAKATLECGWILDQIERINNGEEDVFDYTFYGLKSFNEIIKSGSDHDLTQTKDTRRFNSDYDWKRKLLVIDGVVSPFSVPHLDLKEMLSHRNQVEKIHSWGKVATNEVVIQSEGLKNSKTRYTGGVAAAVVRAFMAGMLFDHISGGVKVEVFESKKNKQFEKITERINKVWHGLEFKFERRALTKKAQAAGVTPKPVKEVWSDADLKNIARKDGFEACAIPPRHRLEVLVKALCIEFQIDYEVARRKIFACEINDNADTELKLQVALAILQAPALGIEPFKSLYENHQLPTRDMIVRDFHPHLSESLIASNEHNPFQKGKSQNSDKSKLEAYFISAGLNRLEAEACVKVMLPVKAERTEAPRNPSAEKCVRIFAQALRMEDIVQPTRKTSEIVEKLQKYGYRRDHLYSGRNSKFEYKSINDTSENRKLIKKLSKLFNLDPTNILNAMLNK